MNMFNFKMLQLKITLFICVAALQGAAIAGAVEITDWLDSEHYQSAFDDYFNRGYYPKFVQGKLSNGVALFQGFFDNDYGSGLWRSCHGLDDAAYASLDTWCRQNGILPYWSQAFVGSGGTVLHQATWLASDMMHVTTLSNGATIEHIDNNPGTLTSYKLTLPASTKHVVLSATNNEYCTIRVNFNRMPSQYDSYTLHANTLILNNPPSGTLYLTIESQAAGNNATLTASAVSEYAATSITTNSIMDVSKTTLATNGIITLNASAQHPLLYIGNAKGCILYISESNTFTEESRTTHRIAQNNAYYSLSDHNGSQTFAKLFCQDKTTQAVVAAVPRSLSIPPMIIATPTFMLLN